MVVKSLEKKLENVLKSTCRIAVSSDEYLALIAFGTGPAKVSAERAVSARATRNLFVILLAILANFLLFWY